MEKILELEGLFLVKISDKGRVIIPVEFRRQLKDSIIITPDLESKKCLLVFPVGRSRENNSEVVQKLKISKEGRIQIPISLRKLVNLESKETNRDVVILGNGDHFQIWNKEIWEGYIDVTKSELKSEFEKELEQIFQEIGKKLKSNIIKEILPILSEFSSQLIQSNILTNAAILTLIKKRIVSLKEINESQEEIIKKIDSNPH